MTGVNLVRGFESLPLRWPAAPVAAGPDQRVILQPIAAHCTHLDHVLVTEMPEEVDGCEECLASGTPWLHLRICLECGHVGCCDSSPEKHATAHAQATGHPIIRSVQPREEWAWCYLDEVTLVLPKVHGQPRIPSSPLGG